MLKEFLELTPAEIATSPFRDQILRFQERARAAVIADDAIHPVPRAIEDILYDHFNGAKLEAAIDRACGHMNPGTGNVSLVEIATLVFAEPVPS